MEHWFDRLSRPQTRRTALKAAAAAAGAALALPAIRPQTARATEKEPCFEPCVKAAAARWDAAGKACLKAGDANHWVGIFGVLYGNLNVAVLQNTLATAGAYACLGSAELTWHRDAIDCRGSECGNGAKYPGGTAPPPTTPKPKCDPKVEFACGDTCCATINKCCPNPNAPGGYSCWSANHVC